MAVHYGEKGKDFEKCLICNVAIAYNSKYFAIGIPEKRAFGVFSLVRNADGKLDVLPPTMWVTKVSSHQVTLKY
jgi:hypothetical protein